ARLSQMLQRAQPRVVITHERHASRVSGDIPLIRLDSDISLSTEPEDDIPETAGPDDPLYVIFTSGSTGEPKGAVVQRRGFANLIEWYSAEFSINAEDRFLLLSSPSFDLTQKNFFAPLNAGGTLACYPPGPFDLTCLASLIERHGITIMNCTPSAFYPLVDSLGDAAFKRIETLRLVVLGGEIISIPRLRPWLEHSTCNAEIANTYGPTECTDICGFYRLNLRNLDRFPFVPLGQTISNVQLAIVDDALRAIPQGEAGELIIGGAGVGLGYLGDAARTAEKFITNPLPDFLDGEKAYRTGDRVRLLPEGILEFLGRDDHQVKIRGFRIELPEIESALSLHPSIREVAVVIQNEDLMAFYIPSENAASADIQELRAFLSARLPDYMVPRQILALEKFPLTPNGKVDRLQLATLSVSSQSPENSAPVTDLESSIHTLWKSVLEQENIGRDDNFFDLGGDSIQLARVHRDLSLLIARPIPITDLFANPSIRTLAQHLGGATRGTGNSAIRERALKQRQALTARRNPH
ncbi:MAG: non-ribosomal peptide synthetase, partial [Chthoniobacterales bacterium]